MHVSGSLDPASSGSFDDFDLRRNWWGSWTIPGSVGSSGPSGIFSGLADTRNIDGIFEFEVGSAIVGQATTFGLGQTLALRARATGDGSTFSHIGDFSNTVSLSPSGVVFVLPDGYTVNSASAGIVNNQLDPVPEPGVALMVLVGSLAVAGTRRRVA